MWTDLSERTLAGPGADRLTVQRSTAPGTAAFPIFKNDSGSNSTISVLTITNGSDGDGEGVFNRSILLLSNCIDANGALAASKDDWRSSQEAEIIATTIPPPDDREAAILTTLPPGPSTAIVRGKNGASGIALIEVYGLTE